MTDAVWDLPIWMIVGLLIDFQILECKCGTNHALLWRGCQPQNTPQYGVPLNTKEKGQLVIFGANVRRERSRRGLTQEKLAEQVELHPRTLQKIEAGEVNILMTTIVRIKKALACSWDLLMSEREV